MMIGTRRVYKSVAVIGCAHESVAVILRRALNSEAKYQVWSGSSGEGQNQKVKASGNARKEGSKFFFPRDPYAAEIYGFAIDIRNWIRNIEQHASDNVNKILVGNKADMDESKRAVPTSKGQALADEYGIKFFETSAKTNLNVEEVFFSIARDIKQRLADTDSRAEPQTIKINQPDQGAGAAQAAQKSACCGS